MQHSSVRLNVQILFFHEYIISVSFLMTSGHINQRRIAIGSALSGLASILKTKALAQRHKQLIAASTVLSIILYVHTFIHTYVCMICEYILSYSNNRNKNKRNKHSFMSQHKINISMVRPQVINLVTFWHALWHPWCGPRTVLTIDNCFMF